MKQPKRIFFWCTHNRCRSQLAASYTSFYADKRVQVDSGGIDPRPVHPLTVQVLQEEQVPCHEESGKLLNMISFVDSDVIIILCDETREACPVIPFGLDYRVWPITDPLATNNPTILAVRQTRDEIKMYVRELLNEYGLLSFDNGRV